MNIAKCNGAMIIYRNTEADDYDSLKYLLIPTRKEIYRVMKIATHLNKH